MFSKKESAELLRGLVERSERPLLCEAADVGVVARSVAEVQAAADGRQLVVKAPFSTAGRDRMRTAGALSTPAPAPGTGRAFLSTTPGGTSSIMP